MQYRINLGHTYTQLIVFFSLYIGCCWLIMMACNRYLLTLYEYDKDAIHRSIDWLIDLIVFDSSSFIFVFYWIWVVISVHFYINCYRSISITLQSIGHFDKCHRWHESIQPKNFMSMVDIFIKVFLFSTWNSKKICIYIVNIFFDQMFHLIK